MHARGVTGLIGVYDADGGRKPEWDRMVEGLGTPVERLGAPAPTDLRVSGWVDTG